MSDKKKKNLSTEKDIIKQYGKVISTAREFKELKDSFKVIPFGPRLDLALNGGILEGTWTIVSGSPKHGKTTSILQLCKNAQDEERNVVYIDGESRLKGYNLAIDGLDIDKFQIVHNEEDAPPLAAEDFLKICESLIKMPKNKGSVCVIDSSSSLVPRSELEQDPSATIRASLPKLLAHWVKKNAHVIIQNKIIMVIITHYITNTSGYGKVKVPDCGTMVQYQADNLLDIVKKEDWIEGDKRVGIAVHWKISSSALGASGNECVSYVRFGKGIDEVRETIELAESFGIIEKSGSWYTCPSVEDMGKLQGIHKVCDFFESNPESFNNLYTQVKEVLS